MNGGTALAPRSPRLHRADRLVVVSGSPNLPAWIREWSDRAGTDVRVRTVPVGAPGHRPALSDVVAAITASPADRVLVVPPEPPDRPVRDVTAALHDLPDDAPVLAAAADTARHLGGTLVLTHGLPISFAERSVGLRTALDHGHHLLDDAAQQLDDDAPGVRVVTRLVRAHAHELVGEDLDTGLLVIGGPRRHVPDALGLVARTALHHAVCPVLIVPR
jgi:nucleotide-binding universal stress UspA family protein